jgi:glycosyltransferase involved in cell wall biosynthesis
MTPEPGAQTQNVVHATPWRRPHSMGGVELYVDVLARSQAAAGWTCTIASPVSAERMQSATDVADLEIGTVRVRDFADQPLAADISPNHPDLQRMMADLKVGPGTIWHQHGWTQGLWLPHLRAARAAGATTVVTIHLAGDLCLRGSMMRFGRDACDGRIDVETCAACWAHSRGAPERVSHFLASGPAQHLRMLTQGWMGGRLATGLSARELASDRLNAVHAMFNACDGVLVQSRWLEDMVLANGCPDERVFRVPLGVDPGLMNLLERGRAPDITGQLKIAFIGRLHPGKGAETLVRAVRAIPPATGFALTVHGLVQTDEDKACASDLRRLADGDPRITLAGPVARDQLASVLLSHDVLAVPSQGLETGPFVVLEALAAGAYVVGSNIGGVAEMLAGHPRGKLVAPGDISAWTVALATLAADPAIVRTRRGRHVEARTLEHVGQDVLSVYYHARQRRRQVT